MPPAVDAPRHPLRGLLLAQFLGAFNDNAWKLIVALLAIRSVRARLGEGGPAFEAASQTQTALAFVVFTLPLVLMSLPAGLLADRLSKRSVILATKALEVLFMAAGTAALFVSPSGYFLPLVVLGLMGAQSALFGPAKYGILPEILPHDRLSAGNALIESCTFVAIIAGTAAGGWLLDATSERVWLGGAGLTLLALAGFVAALAVPRVAPARTEGGLASTLRGAWSAMRADRVLWLAALGSVFYWGIASLLGQDVLVYIKTALQVTDAKAGLPLAIFGLGVGGGSLFAARWSASKVEYGLIPLGAIGLACGTLLLGATVPGFKTTLALMTLLGMASGLLIVPLNALLQWRAPGDRRGAVIALANVLIFSGILAGSLAAEALSRAGLSPREILVGAALATLAGTAWALRILPDALLRLVLVLLTHTVYRLKVLGRTNVPAEGGALLVPNHISFVDGLLVLASTDRPVRFVVDAEYFHFPLFTPFLKALGAIPISASGGPRMILRALRDAGHALDQGDLVCIFAEGQITRTGMLLPFRRGLERIVKGRTVPILPIHLDRVWGSIFSRAHGRFVTKVPERVPYPVTISFGTPLPPGTPLHEVRRAVHELGEASAMLRKEDRRPLHHQFAREARRRPFGFAFADATRPRLSRIRALAGAIALARALRTRWQGQDFVGVLLPPGVPAALVNLAASLAGRASVNLNFTAGRAGMESAAMQAGLRTVVTSRVFLEKAKIEMPGGVAPIWIEDLAVAAGRGGRLWSLVLAFYAPVRLLERACGAKGRPSVDDVVTVIFSSGSTGEPKGVLLTHFNVDANVEAVAQVFHVDEHDRVLGILPLFHSFGYLILWFSINHRMGVVFHPNPLDAGMVGELVQRHRVTILVATPTFLQIYLRRCTPAQFGSLRIVLVGAEKLTERLAQAFEDHFGLRPLEGYGTTECAPAIAISALDFRAPGCYQPGSRRGFVGQPLPGVAVRIVDPESFALLPPGTPGMLLVKGPNIMKGYLGRDDLTRQVMRDGWYTTGDIALMDEDGFVRITDRLSRFSKIGGEMVPHGRIEEALHEAAGGGLQVFAVTAVPDERKGERLAVLHTLDETLLPEILRKAAASGLPNLFLPRLDHFVRVEAIPVLGTGKLDLREVKRRALEALATTS
jgi:acyl-[acyl-carrier-protein]-phospholipid O-acyltransferase / long-chain-fatty-acid--[acyl-carrier-protein] ligase